MALVLSDLKEAGDNIYIAEILNESTGEKIVASLDSRDGVGKLIDYVKAVIVKDEVAYSKKQLVADAITAELAKITDKVISDEVAKIGG